MPDIFALLGEYVEFFPLMAFFGLLLAALSVPISEDLIIISGALLSHEDPGLLLYNLLAIYCGVIAGDFFAYWIGTRAGSGAAKTSFFTRLIPEKVLKKMHYFMDKYGIFTFIVGRFIPFGVRNSLFFSAGFFRLRFKLFVVYDIVAAMISVNTLFFLVYHFGETIQRPIKIAGVALFILVVSGSISLIIRLIVLWRRRRALKKGSRVP